MTKFRLLAAIPMLAGLALAQNTNTSQGTGTAQPGTNSASGTAQSTTRSQTATSGSQTTMTGSQPGGEVNTQTFKGVLIDANCGSSGTSSRNTASSTGSGTASSTAGVAGSGNTASNNQGTGTSSTQQDSSVSGANSSDRTKTDKSTTSATQDRAGNRSGGSDRMSQAGSDQSMSCPVSASTNAFALKMKDGRVLKFDDVGNSRASEALKTKTKWTTAASNNKPVKAKVSGMVTGDTITVISID